MNLELEGKVALVTGASRGIGKAIARALVAEGCRVVLNGRTKSDLSVAAEDVGGDTFVAPGDVSDPKLAAAVVLAAVDHYGKLDIVVTNVGSGTSVPPGDENYAEWQRVMAKNLWSTTNTVEAARQSLAKTQGVIVCISSICGLNAIPGAPLPYSAAKAAINAYVRGVARPLGKDGIRINAIAPGNINFPGSVWHKRLAEQPDAVNAMLKRDVALARFGSVEDIANLVAMIASNKCAFVTGSVWTVDGGQIQ